MTPGEYQALTELVRETLARARDIAGRSAEIRATAAELTVIAEDLCSRARADRERAQELASGRLRRCQSDAVVVHLGTGQPFQALNRLSPRRDPCSDPAVIKYRRLRRSSAGVRESATDAQFAAVLKQVFMVERLLATWMPDEEAPASGVTSDSERK